ncbi:Cob(I)yrinic acid a,c-diamide adenosyltransferase [Crateriforma conspicua]|uniref:Corrinoid adenosyltransferase n=1 Tax=Crateriforma conspicua TaxID=2527996 RepID=A0A5C6FVK5_9PLAN|nr:Cob(I)yrinic acid a,c-diamide adenosyltransferase [Crateriforma conspicua]
MPEASQVETYHPRTSESPAQVKIYTRSGDGGSTGLFGGPRVEKDDVRIEAYGTVDELNAVLGWSRSAGLPEAIDGQIENVQSELFSLGAELATPEPDKHGLRVIGSDHIERLETWIDDAERSLPELKSFILPAGDEASTRLHIARGVCRRAERRVVSLRRHVGDAISEDLVIYLNRLSDFLFVQARAANHRTGQGDQPWRKP